MILVFYKGDYLDIDFFQEITGLTMNEIYRSFEILEID